jgi:hypothetical protein
MAPESPGRKTQAPRILPFPHLEAEPDWDLVEAIHHARGLLSVLQRLLARREVVR